MQIVQINDYEYWIGPSLEACVADYRNTVDDDPEQSEDARVLSDAELDGLKFQDSDEDERPIGEPRPFREQLAREIAEGGDFPRMFACSDW